MNIERMKYQHVRILKGIDNMRELAHEGIRENATLLAGELRSLSRVITAHLGVEERVLYPTLFKHDAPEIVAMAHDYRDGMQGIIEAFTDFSNAWSDDFKIKRDPEGFRSHANIALKALHQRMQKENRHFYPTIEALGSAVTA
jgi:iron-sulfur cluster repair protein YtfE (RIC family)